MHIEHNLDYDNFVDTFAIPDSAINYSVILPRTIDVSLEMATDLYPHYEGAVIPTHTILIDLVGRNP